MSNKKEELQKHRVIGIRSALKALKKDGLIDADSMYPNEAVKDVQKIILKTATKWYRIGAIRGAKEALNAIIKGNFETVKAKDGSIYINAHSNSISWKRTLTVTTGNEKQTIKRCEYRVTIEELDFE